ncbi:hypothetical protein [Rhodococcus sp. NPDC059234]|uniref:hypothetical protein n=1 Tax=Rhodococcus sp. NPDC059234 TaxID=3346781 RepID=UPI00367160B2
MSNQMIVIAYVGGVLLFAGTLLLIIRAVGRRARTGLEAGRNTYTPGNSSSNW